LPDEEKTTGIPAKMRVPRNYTLSAAAIEARRRNAKKSTGPKTPEGKAASSRNAWKHGLYASSRLLQFAKPCRSTCPKFSDCEIVGNGVTSPGGDCLDKEHLLEAVIAIDKAVREQDTDSLNELVAFELAEILQVIRRLRADILEDGTIIKSEKLNKEGEVIGYEYKLHPGLLALPKLLSDFGLTLPDFRLTPKEIHRSKDVEDGVQTIAQILSGAGTASREKKE